MERRDVGILGATGTVGQRFIQLLANHPWFNITWLAASDRSAGKPYAEACNWKLDTPMPANIARMIVQPNTPEASTTPLPRIIFAALDAAIASELEPKFADAGCAVISNSSAFRMTAGRPPRHPRGQRRPPRPARNPGDPQSLRRLHRHQSQLLRHRPRPRPQAAIEIRFGIDSLFVSTMQAISGAGYPGVPALDILGNVVPYIKNEEEKLEEECNKLLGTLTPDNRIKPLPAKLSAHCNRVAVEDGHTECVSIKLKTPATYEQILSAWQEFQPFGPTAALHTVKLPTAPAQPVEFEPAPDRPQPRLDRMRGNGMASTVGRLRPCRLLDWKFVVLSHNTLRGAAGAAVLNAEVLAVLGKLDFKHVPPLRNSKLNNATLKTEQQPQAAPVPA